MYEANPMSFIVEQAGGACSTGRERIMEIKPTGLHMRVPVILGSKNEVERVVSCHNEAQIFVIQTIEKGSFGSLFHLIQWTSYTSTSTIQHMSVNHGGGNICMSQKFLYRADIIAAFQ